MTDQTDHRDRVITEVLGGVDHFEKAPGPDGPWAYRSLTIKRTDNRVFVKDVDGTLAKMLVIPAPERQDNADLHDQLKTKLDHIHNETLNDL
jgi:hypothetical protein